MTTLIVSDDDVA